MPNGDKTIIVQGEMYWNDCTVENKMSEGKHAFELSNLSDVGIAAINGLGATQTRIKKDVAGVVKEEQGIVITLRKAMKSGIMQFKGPDGTALTKDEVATIGNGSKIRVKIGTYTNDFGGPYLSFLGGKVLVWNRYEAGTVGDDLDYPEDDEVVEKATSTLDVDLSDLDDEVPFGQEEITA